MSVVMNLQEAAQAIAATLIGAEDGATVVFRGVSTDSRKIEAGQLFIALRGENFDGHEFLATANAAGAVAAVVAADAVAALPEVALPLMVVEDTRLALGALAAAWRSRFVLPLVAVTGSNGKTTSKEMLSSIMRAAHGDAVLATQGNFNNDIGLPLTLLTLSAQHRAAVIEMGMNHPGEIAYLARIARPTVALVTNAQRAHLEGMGSIDMIAREKGSVFEELVSPGVAVFRADDEWTDLWREQSTGHATMTFALDHPAEVTGHYQAHGLDNRLTIKGGGQEVEVTLALPGAHNARNALGAAAAALAAGVSLEAVGRGLNAFRGIKGRLQRRAGVGGAMLLDDTYNANPDSVRAGIDVLASTVGKKILVLGDMGEIGDMTGQFHDEVGGYAKSQGVDLLFALGDSSALAAYNFGIGGRHFKKIEDLVPALLPEMTADATVLIKGSRFMRMERVVEAVAAPDTDSVQPEEKK